MAIDQILKRNFWAIFLILVASAAFLDAQGIMQLVGASLAADEKQLAMAPPGAKALPGQTTASPRGTSADPIFAHNPFDSQKVSLNPVVTEETNATVAPLDLSDPLHAPPCDGVKVLVIAASADPDWSFAAMTSGSDPKSMLRRRGGEIGTKTVKFIGWDRVWLTGGSTLCQAEMFRPASASPASVAAVPTPGPAPPAGGPGALDPAIAKGIVKVSTNEFNVDRGVVDKILENQAELMGAVRIFPERQNGRTVGIRLSGVRPDALLGVLGMENGDRLQTINGFDMTSPEKALEAYARLRTADHLTIQINRRGANQNLDYDIK